jgi:hypothetical protein
MFYNALGLKDRLKREQQNRFGFGIAISVRYAASFLSIFQTSRAKTTTPG